MVNHAESEQTALNAAINGSQLSRDARKLVFRVSDQV